uniref:Uncharacterized protein n=1 Tax=Chromera velia CCMP2878 TaxID=1169474 RepID=A0A0G4HLX0_9ALVE|eukprot:Cvel_28908.t1-p1 / transcript=Cvel_28908.t1 / gene=Cvel_28908 / organism=Chromera_velia_CCMP2878 / gene_product=hypothetical protein / transcript_product=hypothetical protein / location=Cvel_scaffold3867:495-1115(-) / protein_length=207 / sequence_SO=supercontig / SO=protein_coding / is_pseudo=false
MTIEEGLQLCFEAATGHRQAQTSRATTLFPRRRPREKRSVARIIACTAFLILVASPVLAAHSPPTALCAQTVKGIPWSVPSPTFFYAHIQRVRCSGHSASPTFASELWATGTAHRIDLPVRWIHRFRYRWLRPTNVPLLTSQDIRRLDLQPLSPWDAYLLAGLVDERKYTGFFHPPPTKADRKEEAAKRRRRVAPCFSAQRADRQLG